MIEFLYQDLYKTKFFVVAQLMLSLECFNLMWYLNMHVNFITVFRIDEYT